MSRPMNPLKARNIVLAFASAPGTVTITIILIGCLFLAMQEKQPLSLDQYLEPMSNGNCRNVTRSAVNLPLSAYGGPVVLRLKHRELAGGGWISVRASGREIVSGRITPDAAGSKGFFLEAGTLIEPDNIEIRLETNAESPSGKLPLSGSLEFPKAGFWLIPDLHLWIELILIAWLLGASAALLWCRPRIATATYALFAVLMTMGIYFFGMQFASRIGSLIYPVVILFVALLITRAVFRNRWKSRLISPNHQ